MAGRITKGKALAGAAATGVATLAGMSAYALRYRLNDETRKIKLLGDDYLDPSREPVMDAGGCAIEIDAPAEVLWQHIKQMGQDRAGWYSFEILERLFTFDIHNHYAIHPEWQDRQPGQFLFYHQPPLGIGSDVMAIDEEARQMATCSDSRRDTVVPGSMHLVPPVGFDYFCWTWNFGAIELGPEKSLYISKAQVSFEPFTTSRKAFVATVLGFPSYFMLSRQCDLLKQVCEGRKPIVPSHV